MGPHSKSGWLTQICLVLWGRCTYMQVNAHVCMSAGVHVCTPPTHTHVRVCMCAFMWGQRTTKSLLRCYSPCPSATEPIIGLELSNESRETDHWASRITTLGLPNAASTGDLDALFRMSYLLSPNRCFSFVCSFFVLGSHVSLYKLQRGIAFVCQLSRFHGRQIHQESSESFPYRLTHNSPE